MRYLESIVTVFRIASRDKLAKQRLSGLDSCRRRHKGGASGNRSRDHPGPVTLTSHIQTHTISLSLSLFRSPTLISTSIQYIMPASNLQTLPAFPHALPAFLHILSSIVSIIASFSFSVFKIFLRYCTYTNVPRFGSISVMFAIFANKSY